MFFARSFLIASLFFLAMSWGPAAAHLFELPAKIGLPAAEYLVVQQIYRGWALFGIAVLGALVSTAGFAWTSRRTPWAGFAWTAFFCVIGAQILFWVFTFPANQATENWTMLPIGWESLRARWEYSHAVAACVNLLGLCALLGAVFRMTAEADRLSQ